MLTISTPKKTPQQFIQEAYILATGRIASRADMTTFLALVTGSDYSRLDAVIDDYMNGLTPGAGGVQKMVQSIAKNGLGLTISDTDAPEIVAFLGSIGINSWSKLLHWLSDYQGGFGDTLSNRGTVANEFLLALDASGKASFFSSPSASAAAKHLLQNISATVTSLETTRKDFTALANNLTANGIKGVVVDGYVKSATVFIDADGDGQKGPTEFSTTTNAAGAYVLPANVATGSLRAFGGTDLLTALTFKGVLSAPAGSTAITPLTTLVQTMMVLNANKTLFEITATVKNGLLLSAGVNVLSYDPWAVLASNTATVAQKAEAFATQKVALQVANTITLIASAVDASSTEVNLLSAATSVTNALAAAITAASTTSAGTLNLTSTSVILPIVQASIISAGVMNIMKHAGQIAAIVAASNSAAAAASTLEALAKAAVVAHGVAVLALVSGIFSDNLTAAVNGFTGQALSTAISQAQVGEIAPGIPVVVTPPVVEPPADDSGNTSNAPITVSGTPTVAELNAIAGATSGVVTATLAPGLLASFATLSTVATDVITITVNDPANAALSATDLATLGNKTAGVVTVSNAVAISGTTAEVSAALVTEATKVIATTANVTLTDTPTIAQLNAIAAATTGVVTATISGTVAALGALTTASTDAIAITITGANPTVAELNAIAAATTGVVTATISGTIATLGALATASTDAISVTVTDALSVDQFDMLNARTSVNLVLTGGISDTAAHLAPAGVVVAGLTSATAQDTDVAITITGANPTVTELNAIAVATTGVVTATISGTPFEVSALTTEGTDLITVTVTVTDPMAELLDADAANSLDEKTSGSITILGSGARDDLNLAAATGHLVISGLGENDTIVSGSGADTITGGIGEDQLTGGAGADTFVMVAEDRGDTIANFEVDIDVIDYNTALRARDGEAALTFQSGGAGEVLSTDTTVFELTGELIAPANTANNLVEALTNKIEIGVINMRTSILFVNYLTGGGAQVWRFLDENDADLEVGELSLLVTLTGVDADAIGSANFV